MKIFTGSLLLFVVISCSFQRSYEDTYKFDTPKPAETKSPSPSPTAGKVQIDIPKLVGKSPEDIVRILGKPKRISQLNKSDETGEMSFDYNYSGGEYWINFKNGKADYFHIPSRIAYVTSEEFGDAVGLNLKDVYPATTNAAMDTYSGKISDINWYQIRISKSGEGYTVLTARKTP